MDRTRFTLLNGPISLAGDDPRSLLIMVSDEDRDRMSGPALRTCRRIGEAWGTSGRDLAALIAVAADVETMGFRASDEQLTRMSLILGVWRELAEVFGPDDPRGYAYVRTERELTSGRRVLEVMLSGLEGLWSIRRRLAVMADVWLVSGVRD